MLVPLCQHRAMPHSVIPPYLLEQILDSTVFEVAPLAAAGTLGHDQARRADARVPQQASALPASAAHGLKRAVYDGDSTENQPGVEVRAEGQPPVADPAVNEAYDGLGATYDFYSEVFGRDSIDGRGLPLRATVHYGVRYDNAFWDGARMVFGDGDGEVFGRFTSSISVIGHELTHGVTQYCGGLDYQDQSGALNESLSDVFGALVEQYRLGQTADRASWLIGAGLFRPGIRGVAIRSMKAPGTAYDDPRLGKDPQPATMAGYRRGTADNGGVHLNSGIPNHAFYLVATAIGGPAWERAGRIWYRTLTDGKLGGGIDFAGFAQATLDAASTLYGADSAEAAAVQAGWQGVGVSAASVRV
jgi:Zn-dependent metalloprotease